MSGATGRQSAAAGLRAGVVPCLPCSSGDIQFVREANDPMTATAFDCDRIPLGAAISATLRPDIGHRDVPDMREVLGEAYEKVEKRWLDRSPDRDFVFENTLRFCADPNPD